VLVNNAGIGIAATTPDTASEDWERVLAVCLTGTFLAMKHAIPLLRAAGGWGDHQHVVGRRIGGCCRWSGLQRR
jgi:NAD(P)-dependent dehydrogenase (short-subunit alcohol dehydrogenase family)